MASKYGKGKRKMPVQVKDPKTGKIFYRQQTVGSDKLEDSYYNNFGVKLSGTLNGYTNDILYRGLYFLNQAIPVRELNKMHQLTIHITDNFDEDTKKTSNVISGKYVDDQGTIFISPKFKQSLSHEYGHYIKDLILSSKNNENIKDMREFITRLSTTDIVKRVSDFPFKNDEEKQKYLQWISTPDELFAKYFEQFISYKLKGVKSNFVSHHYDEYTNKPQFFNEYEFKSLLPGFEKMLKSVIGNEVLEKAIDFLLSL